MALNKFTPVPDKDFTENGHAFTCYEMVDYGAGSKKFRNYAFKDEAGSFIAKHRSEYGFKAAEQAKKKAVAHARTLTQPAAVEVVEVIATAATLPLYTTDPLDLVGCRLFRDKGDNGKIYFTVISHTATKIVVAHWLTPSVTEETTPQCIKREYLPQCAKADRIFKTLA